MKTTQALKKKVAVLEEDVRQLKQQIQQPQGRGAVSGRTAPDFLDQFSGIFANDPTFAEAERLGREWREADRPSDEEPAE